MCNHPSYQTVVIQYLPALMLLDGEHIKLQRSVQQALLDEICRVDDDWTPPPRTRWLEGLDLDRSLPDVSRVNTRIEESSESLKLELLQCEKLINRATELSKDRHIFGSVSSL